MKRYSVAIFALLAGLVIGGWGPRSDLMRANKEIKEARELLKKNNTGSSGIDSVTHLLGITDNNRRKEQRSYRQAEQDINSASTSFPAEDLESGPTNEITADAPANEAKAEDNPEKEEPENAGLKNQIEKAAELWQLRSDIARSAFIANARLTDEYIVQFDVLVEAMNLRIANEIELFAGKLKQAEEQPSSEAGVRLANGVTKALVLTYDEMDRTLPGEWRAGAGKDFELVNFINPMVAMPLTDVEDKLNRPQQRQR